ncbi:MAG: hypothetical protein N2482_02190 [Patescibacteria group bacterium]|nr:hypothetical protein [Patescibacteria group bacterium]
MKKRINLFSKQKKYQNLEILFSRLYSFNLIISFFFLIMIFLFFFILINLKKEKSDLTKEKENILMFLLKNKEAEVEYSYLKEKEDNLKKILKDDVNFIPYYNLITSSLKSASPEPVLKTMTIDKNRQVNLILSFDNLDSFFSFIKFAESDNFLKNFSQLTLSNFNLTQIEKKNDYQLTLKGKLNEIKD